MKSRTILKIGDVGSNTRSQGQILERPCVRSRGHIFCSKLGQNLCLNEIINGCENGSRQVKN